MQADGASAIPQFYFPGSAAPPIEARRATKQRVEELLSSYPGGVTIPALKEMLQKVCLSTRARTRPPAQVPQQRSSVLEDVLQEACVFSVCLFLRPSSHLSV
jgi:hypothetical protein